MTLRNIDFKSGSIYIDEFNIDPRIKYDDQRNELSEDLLHIKYSKNYAIDVGWLPDRDPNGRFIIRVIKDDNWESPICRKETRNFQRLEKYIQKSVNIIDNLINSKISINDLTQKQFNHDSYENFDFKRLEFQKFFDEEYVYDIESGSFYFSKTLENEFEIAINILAIDNFIALTLRHNVNQIVSLGFEGTAKIALLESDSRCFLDLYKEDASKPYWSFLIKPRVSLDVLIK